VPFHHPSPENVSARDIVAAGHRGDVDLVEAARSSVEPASRAAALGALLRLGRLDADAWRTFAHDPDATVRRRAGELAPRLPDAADTESTLTELLADDDEIVEVAAFALGELGTVQPSTVDRLEQVVRNHDDALCREAAVAALGALHSGLETILHACNDKATVRRRAIIALAPFDGPDVEAALTQALEDRDWQVRQAAEDLLSDGSDSS